MTLDEAVAAVIATLDPSRHAVDRRLAREDEESFLLIVLDTGLGRQSGDQPVANGPRLVAKADATVSRLTIPDAIVRSQRMALVEVGPEV